MDKWKSTSIDSQKIEIEQLQDQIENMKKEHQDQLAKKAQEFERWISQKESWEGRLRNTKAEVGKWKKSYENLRSGWRKQKRMFDRGSFCCRYVCLFDMGFWFQTFSCMSLTMGLMSKF